MNPTQLKVLVERKISQNEYKKMLRIEKKKNKKIKKHVLFFKRLHLVTIRRLLHGSNHPISTPFVEPIFQSLSHPGVPATLNRFRYGHPTSHPPALFRPRLQLFLHKQGKHGCSTPSFGAKLVL